MTNPKGTEFESYLLPILGQAWPDVERSAKKGVHDYGDFTNVDGWLVEAKNRNKWDLPQWIRTVQKKVPVGNFRRWMVVFKSDKRTALNDDYVVMPLQTAMELLMDREGLRWVREELQRERQRVDETMARFYESSEDRA